MAVEKGRISLVAYETVSGGLYAIAIIAAATRMTFQIRAHRRLRLDDYFLLFACVCLSGETLFSLIGIRDLYAIEELKLNPSHVTDATKIFARLDAYAKLFYACPSLAWTTIFFVKFAYLYFFRRLVDRLRALTIYWKVLVVITAIAYPVVILSDYVTCPNIKDVRCAQPKNLARSWHVAIFAIALDMLTDALIIALPICLLWNAQIKTRQKIGLVAFLSLNVFMAIVAAVRVGGLRFHGIDEVWLFFWAHVEACVAVSMISLTAFRSVFTSERSRAREQKAQAWYVSAARKLRSRKKSQDEEYPCQLPAIPHATMTGMRTFIRGGRSVNPLPSEGDDEMMDDWTVQSRSQKIQVSYSVGQRVQNV